MSSNYGEFMYLAVRRGPSSAPEHGDESFAMDSWGSGPPAYFAPFDVDMFFHREAGTSSGGSWEINNKLFQGKKLFTNQTSGFSNSTNQVMDFQFGAWDSAASLTSYQAWMWQNRPKFFESTCYLGDGSSNRTHTHNLQAVPKMMWIKRLNSSSTRNGDAWHVYHEAVDASNPENYYLCLESTQARNSDNEIWQQTKPTATNWYSGTSNDVINRDGQLYFICLFAELDGVTKVGGYTGNGGTQNIECGFSNGSRFFIIKRADGADGWKVHDTRRGVVSGNDPFLELNVTNAANNSFDVVDHYSGGFTVNNYAGWNAAGGSYVFYAIAAQ